MKVAVVGAGNWGKNLVRTFSELGALGAIVESSPKLRDTLSTQYPNVPLLGDLSEITNLGISAVAIATPAQTHFAVAKRALEAGLDVFVEKPMTLVTSEAQELARLATSKSRVLMVGHLLLYSPAIRWISQFLKENGLGRVYSFHQERLNLGQARSVENSLESLGVHDLAILLDLVGETPTKVDASGHAGLNPGVEDDVHVTVEFSSGVKAYLHTSWLWPERSRKLRVIGERGMLTYDELAGTVTHHRKSIGPNLEKVENGDEVVFRQEGELLKLELSHFLARLEDRAQPLSDGNNGVAVVAVMEKAMSALKGRAVEKKTSSPTQSADVSVHESAYLDAGAVVGKGTKIWHFSHVSSGSTLGENCSLGQNVFVAKSVKIGNNVKIQNNVSLYEGVILEDYVFCGPSMVFTNVRTPRSAFPRNTASDYHKTLVKRGASIGANATIVCGTTIGSWAFVAAGAVVTKDVPEHAMMAGVPARVIGWACECGITLKFERDAAKCHECGKEFEKTSATSVRRTDNKGKSHADSDSRPFA